MKQLKETQMLIIHLILTNLEMQQFNCTSPKYPWDLDIFFLTHLNSQIIKNRISCFHYDFVSYVQPIDCIHQGTCILRWYKQKLGFCEVESEVYKGFSQALVNDRREHLPPMSAGHNSPHSSAWEPLI